VLVVAGDKRERTSKDAAGRIDFIDGKVGSKLDRLSSLGVRIGIGG
jgi:hypothetical protein